MIPKIKIKNNKIQIDRILWNYIGTKQGWGTNVVKSIKQKRNSIIRLSTYNDIDDNQIEEAIRSSVNKKMVSYGKSFIFRDEYRTVDASIGEKTIEDAFVKLAQTNKEFKEMIEAYVRKNRSFNLGVYITKEGKKRFLVPVFDGLGLPEFHIEFNIGIPYKIELPPKAHEQDIRSNVTPERAITGTNDFIRMINALGYITGHGTLTIYSIGSKGGTNWDTGYALTVRGRDSEELKDILSWVVSIDNQDVRNIDGHTSNALYLTTRHEVANVMSHLGMSQFFENLVNNMKDFEDASGLKLEYKDKNKIERYKEKTKTKTIDLSQYKDEIFSNIFQKFANRPPYVGYMQDAQIKDPQEFINFSFSWGFDENIFSNQDAKKVVELCQEA